MGMLAAPRARYAAAASAGLLPAIGIALLVALLAGSLGAGWLVYRWNKGTAAIAEAQKLKAERAQDRKAIAALTQAARDLQQHGVDATLAYDQAAERMDAIASALETRLDAQRRFEARHRAELDALAAARPDLRSTRLGDDVLRHWNAANAGAAAPGAAAPAAGTAGRATHPVPGATARDGQQPAGADRQPRRSDSGIPPLPRPHGQSAGRLGGMAGHGLALVLQGSQGLAPASARMSEVMAAGASCGARLMSRDAGGEG